MMSDELCSKPPLLPSHGIDPKNEPSSLQHLNQPVRLTTPTHMSHTHRPESTLGGRVKLPVDALGWTLDMGLCWLLACLRHI